MKQELALQAALGSHWTKSNKSLLPLSQGEGVTGGKDCGEGQTLT